MLNFDWSIFWTVFNLLVLFLLLKRFLFGPITKMMESRRAEIEDSLREVADKNAAAEGLQREYKQRLESADAQAAQIVLEAKDRARLAYDTILESAREEAAKAAEQAQKSIALERERMLGEAKDGMAEIVLLTAAKLAQKEMDGDESRRAVNAFLAETEARR